MNSSRFNLRVVFFAVLLAFTSLAMIWALNQPNKIFTSISLIFLWVIEIYLLIRYINKTNNNLLLFLQSFQLNDSSVIFNKNKKLPFQEIYFEFNRIIDQFQGLKIEKEIEHQYFEQIIKHVDTGIIAWDENGQVTLLNHAAKEILGVPHLMNIEKLEKIDSVLYESLMQILPGNHKLIKILNGNEMKSLYIRSSEFSLSDHKIKLVSIQNIRPELEEREVEAWQRLIKVLTHEIVNSVSPIKLVSSSLLKKFGKEGDLSEPEKITRDQILNTREGLQAIHNRIMGLSSFVEDYKTITEIPTAEIRECAAKDVLGELVLLMRENIIQSDITCDIVVRPTDLKVKCDRSLLDQVVINILKNAVHSVNGKTDPAIHIKASEVEGIVNIRVIDNGCGIPFNTLDYIFLPFFTTKKDGSGIGLTLSRQLMKAQDGQISIASKEGSGTTVTLSF